MGAERTAGWPGGGNWRLTDGNVRVAMLMFSFVYV